MCHATALMTLIVECSVNRACLTGSCLQGSWKNAFCVSHVEYCDMHFVYGLRLEVFLLVWTRHCVILAVFPVLLCGLKGRWYERITHEGTFLRWFREVHGCPLVEWPLASAYHVCRFGELYMKNIYIPNMIKGYNIWNQASATQSLLMRTENCQATGGGHFENLL